MIKDLLARIEEEYPRIEGWCPLAKAFDLAVSAVVLRAKLSVEIGVYGGASLIPVAMACGALGRGRVVAIDPWNAAESKKGYVAENEAWWGQVDHEKIYQGFVGHLRRLGLEDIVTVRRSPSDEVEPPQGIDLLSVDGQHTEQAIRDVGRYAPKVRIGGMVIMDDLGWQNSGVQHVALAVDKLTKLGFVELYRNKSGPPKECEWGAYQRIK